ncbi:MAG: plasmid mobilization relaxosome protein MobC [Candidatus Limnocylindria bacterium]
MAVEYSDEEWARVQELAAEARWATAAWIAERSLDPGGPAAQLGMKDDLTAALFESMQTGRQLRGIATNTNQIAKAVNGVLLRYTDADSDGEQLLVELVAVTRTLPAIAEVISEASRQRRDAERELHKALIRKRHRTIRQAEPG